MSDSEPECNWWAELDRNSTKFKFNKRLFELIIHEVFLPKKLPDFYDATKAYYHETLLLALMADSIQELNNELPKSTNNLFQTWSFLQCRQYLEPPEMQNAIASLTTGEIHEYKNRAIVSTFPASLENSLVMSNENDLQASFPSISVSIPFDNFVKSMPFAEQLSQLNEKQHEKAMPKSMKTGEEVVEIRNVADPMYVSKWLLAFLSNENSNVVTGDDFPKVVKKFRDDVIYKGGDLPFRRSGLWMTMKVALRLNLETEFDRHTANAIYKIIQIQLTSKMCEFLLSTEHYQAIDAGLTMHMLAKVARKLDKFESVMEKSMDEFESLYRSVLSSSKQIIIKVREKLDDQFIKLDSFDRRNAVLQPLENLNFRNDSIHEIPSLTTYLEMRSEAANSSSNKRRLLEPETITRHRSNDLNFPDYEFTTVTNEVHLSLLLADVENWICQHCTKCTAENLFSLRNLAVKYGAAAKKHYTNDPLGGSRMILTILQIIRTMDEIATEQHSLLELHHTGINPKIIEDLLLPSRYHMKIASKLERYFEQRNSGSSHPALNAENTVTKESFAYRYAESNEEMIDLRQTILDEEELKIEEKIEQVNRARAKIHKWKEEANKLEHTFVKVWKNYEFKTVHDRHCKLCKLTQLWTKHLVWIYERSIRHEEHNQYAIVFELLIPTEISCLRDVLQFTADEYLFTGKLANNKLNIRGNWIDYEQITVYRDEVDRRVHLGSTSLLYMKSHYAKKAHPDLGESEFVVNNGYNCVYYGPGGVELYNEIEKQTIKKFCTFNVESDSPYRKLQWTLSTTDHTQNEVLASQRRCPIELTLSEFVAFGSLRSDGHRLQMRNIYRALATESLSFEKDSVASLIFQALWQLGPINSQDDTWLREAHEDLADATFAAEMLELLLKYLTSQQDNWKHPLKMMVIIMIATRILELNDDETITTTAVNVLLYSRSICSDWMTRIQTAKSACDCRELNQIQSLRSNMVDAGICCALTFQQSQIFPQLWQSMTPNSALSYWLSAIVNVNNNIILSSMENREFSTIRRTLLRELWIIGINSETLLLQQVTEKYSSDMMANQWSGVGNGTFKQWSSFANVKQMVHTELVSTDEKAQNNFIQVDIILGTFLVNGMPISSLPDVFVNHESFKRVFGSTSFEVQPTDSGTYCTLYKYNDCSYYFKIEMEQLIVKEVRANGDVYEMIPHKAFGRDIPFLLQQDYSHWWNHNEQNIEFRPLRFNVHDFASADQIHFTLQLDTKLLTESKTSRYVIDRLSNSFVRISKQLDRLENEKFIIAIMDGPEHISIELPRMRIQFKLDGSTNEITSHEYVDMKISCNQKFGTFIGLQNGLLLEHKHSSDKLIVMPHGKIKSVADDLNVSIKMDELREPPFFIYDIDDRCQQLKARGSFSAWFYLAHLHAVTSHVLPDPFTNMNGQEKALQIMQSSFCWSSEPYDDETLKTLKRIKKLSTNRSYHPPHHTDMQRIDWPKKLPSWSSHEAYAIVVKRLIEDSERLNVLHFKEKSKEDDPTESSKIFLIERAYRRNLCHDVNAAVSTNFTKNLDESMEEGGFFSVSDSSSEWFDCSSRTPTGNASSVVKLIDSRIKNMRLIAAMSKLGHYHVPSNCEKRLQRLLFSHSAETLQGRMDDITGSDLILELNGELRNMWIDLYNIACDQKFDTAMFTLTLTLLAFNGNELNDLLTLHVVATNPTEFQTIKSPNVEQYKKLNEDFFNETKISEIVSSCTMSVEVYLSQFEEQLKLTIPDSKREALVKKYTAEWMAKIVSQTKAVTTLIEEQWPCDECDLSTVRAPLVKTFELMEKVNPLLKMWNENRQLKSFVGAVCTKIRELSERSTKLENWNLKEFVYEVGQESCPTKYKINFTEKIHRNFNENVYADELHIAEQLYQEGKFDAQRPDINEFWHRIRELHLPTKDAFLEAANIYPRRVPTLILPQMISSTNANQQKMIGALGVLFSLDQRAARLRTLELQQPQMEVALRREREEIPFVNWLPCVYPQWLLFEIEMNLTIRRIQIEVAKNMIQPQSNIHSVMQLNMGEGKTAVIVPLLCAILSNKKHVCQVTVLKPLFKSNLKSLRKCLGGILNHRVFVFPCRRDMLFNEGDARLLMETYHECKRLKGVIITLPEYRLSLQLKMYEASRKKEFDIASILLQTHKWLNKNVRNILDESDALLSAKYQLIYTVGEQLPPDGGELRWLVIQNILKIVPSKLELLWKKYGSEKIEFLNQNFDPDESSEKFRPCRILHPSVYDELQANIANDFVEERTQIPFPKLKTAEKQLVKAVLCNRNVDSATYDKCMKIFDEYPCHQNVIFLMCGLLKFEILQLVFRKRWRVNYGVNPNGNRKMAVPFVAKDVCAENTEFGHPDVAICFTYLSYYYSGLTDVQLLNCFDILSKMSNSDEIYKEWMSCMPVYRVHKSIRTYSGVNLSDASQRTILFTLLRYNMNVIDFWLANIVFPREAKIFDMKMMCTAWDLCSEEMTNVVTGFSGTNDTKLLLPKPICQNDLKELEDTNKEVRNTIIKEENDNYVHLESNVNGVEILRKLVKCEIPVLLDAGALMLELNNEQVAEQWLKLVSMDRFDAAVYFNDKNLLMVVDRQNCRREFDCSPYFDRLDRCIVYLDDAHTRGTDLKFPTGIKACVTLAGGITRDKTVQACMRMRLLGQGHTICFWASEEADNGIRELCKKDKTETICVLDVFNWICHNSRMFEEDGLIHWSVGAYNYSQKLAAYRHITEEMSDTCANVNTKKLLERLSDFCTDKEIIKLVDLYGAKNELSLMSIFENRFSVLIARYSKLSRKLINNDSALETFLSSNYEFVVKRLQECIPNVKRFTHILDEEQEKELEYELEEEREVKRPGKASAHKPSSSPILAEFLRHGLKNRKYWSRLLNEKLVLHVPRALEKTSLWSSSGLSKNETKWGNDIYATNDFVNVVDTRIIKADEFLRPVWWIVSADSLDESTKSILLLLSPYEVNQYLHIFRDNSSTTLRMYSPRLKPDPNINTMINCKTLQLPFDTHTPNVEGLIESQLSVFAGATYFENKMQLENYCTFLGIIPSPFSKEHQLAFDKGQINLNGFVRPQFRDICEAIKNGCPFKTNPDKLVCEIIDRRHGFLPNNSHVAKIVVEGTIAGVKYGE